MTDDALKRPWIVVMHSIAHYCCSYESVNGLLHTAQVISPTQSSEMATANNLRLPECCLQAPLDLLHVCCSSLWSQLFSVNLP